VGVVTNQITVERWISYEEADGMPESLGGMGGWFGKCQDCDRAWLQRVRTEGDGTISGAIKVESPPCPHNVHMRWKDYLEAWKPEAHPYAEALRAAILKLQLREGGDWHQNDANGVPVFSDGTVATFSYRAWGDLLAAVWSEAEDKDYNYMRFYMSGYE
jgi:hypothetical protein